MPGPQLPSTDIRVKEQSATSRHDYIFILMQQVLKTIVKANPLSLIKGTRIKDNTKTNRCYVHTETLRPKRCRTRGSWFS